MSIFSRCLSPMPLIRTSLRRHDSVYRLIGLERKMFWVTPSHFTIVK